MFARRGLAGHKDQALTAQMGALHFRTAQFAGAMYRRKMLCG
jgi:hypothetical protein